MESDMESRKHEFMTEDGYFRAAAMANAFRTRYTFFVRNQHAQEYIRYLQDKHPGEEIERRNSHARNGERGTDIHPLLAIEFARWISIPFYYQVTKWAQQAMTGDLNVRRDISPPQSPTVMEQLLSVAVKDKEALSLVVRGLEAVKSMEDQQFTNEQRRLAEFIQERCELSTHAYCPQTKFYKEFQAWSLEKYRLGVPKWYKGLWGKVFERLNLQTIGGYTRDWPPGSRIPSPSPMICGLRIRTCNP